MCACMYVYACVYVCANAGMCVLVCMHVCVYTCVCDYFMDVYTPHLDNSLCQSRDGAYFFHRLLGETPVEVPSRGLPPHAPFIR